MIVLGIETSCDETAVGIVEIVDEREKSTDVDAMQGDRPKAQQDVLMGTLREHFGRTTQQGAANDTGATGSASGQSGVVCRLLANVVATSIDLHVVYGGVVPEIAARSHIEYMMPVVTKALEEAFYGKWKMENGKWGAAAPPIIHNPKSNFQIFDPWDQIDAIAVTYGAGLGGSLLVGVMTARTLSIVKNKPLYAINHVEAHVYANFLTEIGSDERRAMSNEAAVAAKQEAGIRNHALRSPLSALRSLLRSTAPSFPMLALIVSGGHTQLVLFRGHFDYTLLGVTRDDAVGEAFDKVAKILGLPYPGGPSVAAAATNGDANKYKFPKPRLSKEQGAMSIEAADAAKLESGSKNQVVHSKLPAQSSLLLSTASSYDFSFSGLKTAVLRLAQKEIGEDFTFPSFMISERLSEDQKNDIAASFQRTAIEILVDKTVEAFLEYQPASVVIAGGVAASGELRRQLSERLPITVTYPEFKLCTDNGAMIATLGCFKALLEQPTADPYSLDIEPNLKM